MQEKQRTNRWRCPKCNEIQSQPTMIKEVAHRCKMNKSKLTSFELDK